MPHGNTFKNDACSYHLICQIKSFNAQSSGQEWPFRIKGFDFSAIVSNFEAIELPDRYSILKS